MNQTLKHNDTEHHTTRGAGSLAGRWSRRDLLLAAGSGLVAIAVGACSAEEDGRSDGNPITFSIAYATGAIYSPDDIEPVPQYWQEVGIDATVEAEERSLFRTRESANEHDVAIWAGAGGGIQSYDAILDPRGYIAVTGEAFWGAQWNVWYQGGGKGGVEPPAAAKQQMELYEQLFETTDPAEHLDTMREILRIAKEQFWAIGLALPPADFGIANEGLRNIPPDMVNNVIAFHAPAAYHPEQFFLQEGD